MGEMMPLHSAVWFTTMACNYHCHYCWEVQAQDHGEFKPGPWDKTADRWVAAWNRLRPNVLDVTGGEPFLLPWLVDFYQRLDPAIRCGMTTNISHDLTQFVQKIPPERFINITCSWHPSDNGTKTHPNNLYLFTGRLLMLKERGYPVQVNYVAWPEQQWLIADFKKWFEDHGVRFHVDPYSGIAYYPFTATDAEEENVRKYTGPDRVQHEWTQKYGKNYRVDCSGGIHHINVQPDGSAWRCILDRQLMINPLGNILDEDFALLEQPRTCDEHWRCPGCDRDKVRVNFVGEQPYPGLPVVEV
jgi:MoaA/NifB/PqqE/SkfB family radical SAM enzyme